MLNNSFVDKTSIVVTILALLLRKDQNISQKYKKIVRHNLHSSLKIPPAFNTRERDGVYVPERQTFKDAFGALSLPFMSSKTKETTFQVLNRTIWTNNKAFKSGMHTSPLCFRCNDIETMEHLLFLCPSYSEKVWLEAGHLLTCAVTKFSGEYTARIDLTPKEIVFNKPHPAIMLRIKDTLVRSCILVLIQEIKRDIISRRMQLKDPLRQEVSKIRICAHLLSCIRKLSSLLEYQGIVQNKAPISFLTTLSETITQIVSEI